MQNNPKHILSQVIKIQTAILGSEVAVRIARKVGGCTVDDAGNVTAISGNGDQILKEMIHRYAYFTGEKTDEYVSAVLEENGATVRSTP